jgi:hypothetical protein
LTESGNANGTTYRDPENDPKGAPTMTQTATIEVKHVYPPKDGKQYGAIRGANNDSYPVKKDRIHEFMPGNRYEIAWTEGNNGFKNIIGVKPLNVPAPQAQGTFSAIPPQTNGHAHAATQVSKSEEIFVCGGLYRDIESNRVGASEDELVERTILWRNVWRRAFMDAV